MDEGMERGIHQRSQNFFNETNSGFANVDSWLQMGKIKKVLKRHTDEATGHLYYNFLAGMNSGTPINELPTEWNDFDHFKNVNFSQWQTYLEEDWENGRCNCPIFSKVYTCKHVIGIAIRLKFVDPPIEAKAIPIEQKRKPGRPRNTRPALQCQVQTFLFFCSFLCKLNLIFSLFFFL